MNRHPSLPWVWLAACALSSRAAAQGTPFQTPGMPPSSYAAQPNPEPTGTTAASGQTSRFSTEFNPAFSFVVDGILDYVDTDDDSDDDGFNLEMRTLEVGAQAWVDPKAWAYFIGATDGEELAIEEAAVHYKGLGGNSNIRAGRFFVDFGKQMQLHVHELRTLERPLPLRTYLGDEVKGDGLQWDHWTSIGDETALRWSIGAFASLLPEEDEDFDATSAASISVDDRKDAGDLNYTARATAFTDVGERGTFQLGASARAIPDYSFTFDPSGDEATGLSNTVYGVDATYGWVDDTGSKRWTLGAEYLFDTGDTGAALDDAGTPADPTDDTVSVIDDTVGGGFAFVDYAWNAYHSAGVQYAIAELADAAATDVSEIEVYYSRSFSEFHRLRLGVAYLDSDLDDADSARFALQYTATVGAHGHGINW